MFVVYGTDLPTGVAVNLGDEDLVPGVVNTLGVKDLATGTVMVLGVGDLHRTHTGTVFTVGV